MTPSRTLAVIIELLPDLQHLRILQDAGRRSGEQRAGGPRAAHLEQQAARVQPAGGVVWVEGERAAEAGEAGARAAAEQKRAEVGVRVGVVRVELDARGVVARRLLQLTQVVQAAPRV